MYHIFMTSKAVTLDQLTEALADFRMSLNKDMERFATKEDLTNLATKKDLEEMEARQNQYLSAASNDIVDAIDETNKQHLVKYHHVSL